MSVNHRLWQPGARTIRIELKRRRLGRAFLCAGLVVVAGTSLLGLIGVGPFSGIHESALFGMIAGVLAVAALTLPISRSGSLLLSPHEFSFSNGGRTWTSGWREIASITATNPGWWDRHIERYPRAVLVKLRSPLGHSVDWLVIGDRYTLSWLVITDVLRAWHDAALTAAVPGTAPDFAMVTAMEQATYRHSLSFGLVAGVVPTLLLCVTILWLFL